VARGEKHKGTKGEAFGRSSVFSNTPFAFASKKLREPVNPQVIAGNGDSRFDCNTSVVKIPCWRASECPVMDHRKKHFKMGESESDTTDEEKLLKCVDSVKSLESVHRGLLIVAHVEETSEVVIKNGGCEGIWPSEVLDCLLEGMDSFDLRPTADSNPYSCSYKL